MYAFDTGLQSTWLLVVEQMEQLDQVDSGKLAEEVVNITFTRVLNVCKINI